VTGDTGDMLRTVNWVARALGFAWLGVLAFLISPPHGPSAAPVQIAGYCLLGLGLLAWALIDVHPAVQTPAHPVAGGDSRRDRGRHRIRVRRREWR
jgi:hypothetical protein